MLHILFRLLLITVVAGAENCTPGTRVSAGDGCNTCLCLRSGILAGCTLRDCNSGQYGVRNRRVRSIHRFDIDDKCYKPVRKVPHKDGCNTCYCNEKGVVSNCTQATCSEFIIRTTEGDKHKLCPSEKSFIPDGDCNYCACSIDGRNLFFCTLMSCHRVRSAKDEPCPSKVFKSKDGCNQCRCKKKIAMCTKKKCVNNQALEQNKM